MPADVPMALSWAEHARALTALYGLPSWSFRDLCFWALAGEPGVYVATAGASHPESKAALLNIGWLALTAPLATGGSATPALLDLVGADATRNVVEVDAAGEEAFRALRPVSVPPEADAAALIVRRGRRVLGAVSRADGRAL